jgi:membrane protein
VEALATSVSPAAAQIAMSMTHQSHTSLVTAGELAFSSALSRTSAAATNTAGGAGARSRSLEKLPWYDRLLRRGFLLGVAPLIMFVLRLAPYIMVWLLFTVVYLFMPNTSVKFSAGVVAGIVAGTLYQAVQLGYVMFQIGVSRYNAIYGSFAALPLFLIWLQVSWMIVLYGAELSFAYQNVDTYAFEPDCRSVSNAFKRLVALRLAHTIVERFLHGDQPLTANQLAANVELPIRLTRELLHELVAGGILCEVLPVNGGEPQYQPARDVHALTVASVVQALDARGDDTIPLADSTELEHLRASLDELGQSLRTSPGNKLLMDV